MEQQSRQIVSALCHKLQCRKGWEGEQEWQKSSSKQNACRKVIVEAFNPPEPGYGALTAAEKRDMKQYRKTLTKAGNDTF